MDLSESLLSTYSKEDKLGIEVSDFGPIVEASIDLRPLTVFVGPSNTGKTYLATLIYALHRYFSGRSTPWRFPLNYQRLLDVSPQHVVRETADAFDEFVQQVSIEADKPFGERNIVLPGPIAGAIRSVFETNGGKIGDEIGRCFGVAKTEALIRKGRARTARVVIQRHIPDEPIPFEHELTFKGQETQFKMTVPGEGLLTAVDIGIGEAGKPHDLLNHEIQDVVSRVRRAGKDRDFLARQLLEVIIDLALPQLAGPLSCTPYFLPADRTGVMNAHSTIVNSIIGGASMAGLSPATRIPILTGVLSDFLQQLIDLVQPTHVRSNDLDDLGKRIEDDILNGSVHVESSDTLNYPRFAYRPKGWKSELPLVNASSMVSEIAPLILFLRHFVRRGDALIIEEPESHLHPAMQVEFTQRLVALVHAGVNVIVTTHSEWVLETLGNLVRLAELPPERREGIKGADLSLSRDHIGAWSFKPKRSPRGSVVEEIKFDADAGGLRSDYDEVAERLYNDWATIGNRATDNTSQ